MFPIVFLLWRDLSLKSFITHWNILFDRITATRILSNVFKTFKVKDKKVFYSANIISSTEIRKFASPTVFWVRAWITHQPRALGNIFSSRVSDCHLVSQYIRIFPASVTPDELPWLYQVSRIWFTILLRNILHKYDSLYYK